MALSSENAKLKEEYGKLSIHLNDVKLDSQKTERSLRKKIEELSKEIDGLKSDEENLMRKISSSKDKKTTPKQDPEVLNFLEQNFGFLGKKDTQNRSGR